MKRVHMDGREMRFITTTQPKAERLNKILCLMQKYKITQRQVASMTNLSYESIRSLLRNMSTASLDVYENIYLTLLDYHYKKVKEENAQFGWMVPANYKDHPDYKEPTA